MRQILELQSLDTPKRTVSLLIISNTSCSCVECEALSYPYHIRASKHKPRNHHHCFTFLYCVPEAFSLSHQHCGQWQDCLWWSAESPLPCQWWRDLVVQFPVRTDFGQWTFICFAAQSWWIWIQMTEFVQIWKESSICISLFGSCVLVFYSFFSFEKHNHLSNKKKKLHSSTKQKLEEKRNDSHSKFQTTIHSTLSVSSYSEGWIVSFNSLLYVSFCM